MSGIESIDHMKWCTEKSAKKRTIPFLEWRHRGTVWALDSTLIKVIKNFNRRNR